MWLSETSDRAVEILAQVFGGDAPREPLALYQVAARGVVVYLVGVVAVRVGKSRGIGRLTSLDVILGFILGSLLSRGITGHASLSATAVGSVAIVAAHWLITFLACRSHAIGTLIKGRSRLVVVDGKMQADSMRRSHISEHDLQEELRLHGVEDIRRVKRAYKERNGEISVILE
jgi:uncharacterized membrane protein YcaP (DUF421 family)